MGNIYEFIGKKLDEYNKKGINEDNMQFYANLEILLKTGVLRVLYALSRSKLRMLELQHHTKLQNSVLVPLLQELQKLNMIEKTSQEVKEPRRGKVSIYQLTKIGKKFAENILIEPENDVETFYGIRIKKDLRMLVQELVNKKKKD